MPLVRVWGMSGAQLDMIGIVVSDMSRSLAFYRLLGLDIPPSADTEPHVEVTLRGGGRVGVAFLLPDAAAVDAAHARIVDAGYDSELDPFDAPWGQRYATVRDPDGTSLDLFAWA